MSTPYPTTPSSLGRASTASTTRAARRSSWIYTLTGICFIFGGALGWQVRMRETMREEQAKLAKSQVVQEQQAAIYRRKAEESQRAYDKAQKRIAELTDKVNRNGNITAQQLKTLTTQLSQMQMAAGLTAVAGSGIRIEMADHPESAKNAAGRGGFEPGLIHDFDLLQVVNELRAAGAEAIGIKGAGQTEITRITAYTPIRCVGPVIQIDWKPVSPPFVIEAIGNADALYTGVNMTGGILASLADNSQGTALIIKSSKLNKLELPAAGVGAPAFKVAKPVPAKP